MTRFTYDPASIVDGAPFMAFIVGRHPRFGRPTLATIKPNLIGPPCVDDLKAEKFSGFEPRATDAFEMIKALANKNDIQFVLVVDPHGLLPTSVSSLIE